MLSNKVIVMIILSFFISFSFSVQRSFSHKTFFLLFLFPVILSLLLGDFLYLDLKLKSANPLGWQTLCGSFVADRGSAVQTY